MDVTVGMCKNSSGLVGQKFLAYEQDQCMPKICLPWAVVKVDLSGTYIIYHTYTRLVWETI